MDLHSNFLFLKLCSNFSFPLSSICLSLRMYLLCRIIMLVISTWDGFSMHWCRIRYVCVQWLYFWNQLLILYISFWCRVNCLTIKMLLILESDAHFVCHCTGKLYRTALSYCATSFSQWFKVSSAYISLLGLHNWCEQAGKLVFLMLVVIPFSVNTFISS